MNKDKAEKLVEIVCSFTGVSRQKLVQPKTVTKWKPSPAKTPRGTKEISETRRIASYLLVNKLGLSRNQAYDLLYPPNNTTKYRHTSIIHLLRTHDDIWATEEEYRQTVTQITALYDQAFPNPAWGPSEFEWAGLGCA